MRAPLMAAVLMLLAGCSLTPTQKKWAGVAAGLIIVGTIAAHDDSDSNDLGTAAVTGSVGGPSMSCHPQPDGSCR